MLSISVARSGQTLLLLTNKVAQEARLAKLTFTRGVFICSQGLFFSPSCFIDTSPPFSYIKCHSLFVLFFRSLLCLPWTNNVAQTNGWLFVSLVTKDLCSPMNKPWQENSQCLVAQPILELEPRWHRRKVRSIIREHIFFGSGTERDSLRERTWNILGGSETQLVLRSVRVWMMRSLLGFWIVSAGPCFFFSSSYWSRLWLGEFGWLPNISFLIVPSFPWIQDGHWYSVSFWFGVVVNPYKELGRVTLITRYGARKVCLRSTIHACCFSFILKSRTIFNPKSSPFPTLQSLRFSSSSYCNTFPYPSDTPPCPPDFGIASAQEKIQICCIWFISIPLLITTSLAPSPPLSSFPPVLVYLFLKSESFRSMITFPVISVRLSGQVIRWLGYAIRCMESECSKPILSCPSSASFGSSAFGFHLLPNLMKNTSMVREI